MLIKYFIYIQGTNPTIWVLQCFHFIQIFADLNFPLKIDENFLEMHLLHNP